MASSTTDRRLGLTGGVAFKTPCKAATTAAITLSGTQTVDSIAVTTGDRVLVKNQTDQTTNGIYVVDSATWTRDLDFDGANDVRCGTLVFITSGSTNGAGLMQLTTADTITIGTSNLTFTKIATLSAGAVTQINVQNGQFVECSTVAGTNTITASTVGTAPAALGHGQFVIFIPANTNTSTVTFNRDSLGAVAVQYNGAALIGGELQSGVECLLFHDGTVYELMATSVSNTNYQTTGSIASAATLNLDTAKPYSQVTGVVGVTAITLGNGRVRVLEFASTVTFTASASLILNNGGSNVTTAAGDTAVCYGEGSSVVRVVFTRASGNTVSGTSLVVRSYLAGLTMSTAGSSATMSIAAGQAADSTGTVSMTLSAAISKTTSAWAVGTGNGGIDTGAIANSTWYHFYEIQRPDTGVVDVIFSTSASAPTLPTNYTYYRRIGAGKTNSSAQWVLFIQDGDYFRWSASVQDVSTTAPGTAAVTATLASAPTGVNVAAYINAQLENGSSVNTVMIQLSDLAAADEASSLTVAPGFTFGMNYAAAGASIVGGSTIIRTNTSAQIRYRVNASDGNTKVRIVTLGWYDRRGRDS